ncbi:MAG: hypothetical protein LBC85_11050 [Fibromonadaceae bacterium]|jgi:hypothetical protein|nr:hypothetical protein [Fibromonadaceae bacterium]
MQLIVNISSSKIPFALDVFKSLSFVKEVKPLLLVKKTRVKAANLKLSSQVEELYGIFEGINAPDKKDIRKAKYESNY